MPKHSFSPFAKLYLLLIAFLAGAAVMIVELAANRVLAPMFGNSLYTWTGIIGVILTAMSLGYYFGGALADKSPKLNNLLHLLGVAAIFILAIPLLAETFGPMLIGGGVVMTPILASLVLFALPGVCLGAISPFTIRMMSLMSEDKEIGLSAGKIAMLSTLGSVLGTFLAGFYLIPQMDLNKLFFTLGSLLMLLSLGGYKMFQVKEPKVLVATAVFWLVLGGLLVQGFNPALADGVLHDEASFYHRLRVIESKMPNGDKERQLILDTTVEGSQYLYSTKTPTEYQRYWPLATLVQPEIKRALFLGGGAFQMPEDLLRQFPEASVDVVEIDPKVIEVGKKFFRLQEFPQLKTYAEDARVHLIQSAANQVEKYDFIFGDAYHGIRTIPAHLVTREFFALVKGQLKPEGVYMMNIIGNVRGKNSELFLSMGKTLSEVFTQVEVFSIQPEHLGKASNLLFLATTGPSSLDFTQIRGNAEVRELLKGYISKAYYHWGDRQAFTDNQNPSEYFVAKAYLNP